jgi:hypothetical protein
MILHVKGNESGTRELLKPAIRAAISKGEITHSQLIWSPLDSAWKPVSQMPDLLPGESLILHVKGSESETKEMPKKAIRTEIKEGRITHSQLIWSAAENQWKQVRDLPELLPSQKLAPAPPRKATPMLENIVPDSPQGPVAPAAPQAKAQQATAVRTAQAATPSAAVRAAVAAGPKAAVGAKPVMARGNVAPFPGTHAGHVVEERQEGFHPMKWVCIGLGALILIILMVNYLMVSHPLRSRLAQTPYSNVFVYAHYEGFIWPQTIVIHIPATDKLTPGNMTDFLVALAHSTPGNFDRVALTSGWMPQYSFAGSAWKNLGEMQDDSVEDRKDRILSDAVDAAAQPLLQTSFLSEEAQQAKHEQAWKDFVAKFTRP